jgi:hypothetical protein
MIMSAIKLRNGRVSGKFEVREYSLFTELFCRPPGGTLVTVE